MSQDDYSTLPPYAQADLDNAAIAPTLAAYNAQILLSPSVRSDSGTSDAASSEDEEEESYRVEDNHVRIGVQRWNRYRRDHPRACGGALVSTPSMPPVHEFTVGNSTRGALFIAHKRQGIATDAIEWDYAGGQEH